MEREFRASATSLVISFAWDLSPVAVAILGWHFTAAQASDKGLGWLLVLITGAMCAFSAYLVLQTIFVHLKSISIDGTGITVRGLGGGSVQFQDIVDAQLRERQNVASRTDRLLIIHSNNGEFLTFNPSILRPSDEDDLLSLLRGQIRLSTITDSPTL